MSERPSASDHEFIERVLDGVEYVALAIELLAVTVIAIGVIYAVGAFLLNRYGSTRAQAYERKFRAQLGTSLLVGLEILVAAESSARWRWNRVWRMWQFSAFWCSFAPS